MHKLLFKNTKIKGRLTHILCIKNSFFECSFYRKRRITYIWPMSVGRNKANMTIQYIHSMCFIIFSKIRIYFSKTFIILYFSLLEIDAILYLLVIHVLQLHSKINILLMLYKVNVIACDLYLSLVNYLLLIRCRVKLVGVDGKTKCVLTKL